MRERRGKARIRLMEVEDGQWKVGQESTVKWMQEEDHGIEPMEGIGYEKS